MRNLRRRRPVGESSRVGIERLGERDLAGFVDRVGGTEVHRCRRVPSDAGMVMILWVSGALETDYGVDLR